MDLQLKEKVVLLTGATSGIGEVTAHQFAEEGAHVIVTGRRKEKGEAVAKTLKEKGVKSLFLQMDVTDRDSIIKGYDTIKEKFEALDIIVANAGREQPHTLPIDQLGDDDMDVMIDTNLKGTWLTVKYGLPLLRRPGGSIILLSTEWTFLGGAGLSAYTASKTGVNGLTRQLAVEQGPLGIRVNCVSPGPIITPMLQRFTQNGDMSAFYEANIPLQRAGESNEIADAILYFASERSSYVSGQILAIDGGMTVKMPTAGLAGKVQ